MLTLSRNAEIYGSQKDLNFAKKYELFLLSSSIFKRLSRSRISRSKVVGGGGGACPVTNSSIPVQITAILIGIHTAWWLYVVVGP